MQDVSSGIPIVTTCIWFFFILAVINVHATDQSKPVMLHFCTSFRIETFYSYLMIWGRNNCLVSTGSTSYLKTVITLKRWNMNFWRLLRMKLKGICSNLLNNRNVFSCFRTPNRWNLVYWNGGAEKLCKACEKWNIVSDVAISET